MQFMDADGNPVEVTVGESSSIQWGYDGVTTQGRNGQEISYPSGESTDPHWVKSEVQEYPNWLAVRDPNGWYQATIKHDGCIDFRHAANSPFTLPDGSSLPEWARPKDGDDCDADLHICDLDALIERLQALRDFARQHRR